MDKFVIVFLDDILVYSKTKKGHEEHLRLVMQVQRYNKLYANLSKWSFYQNKIHYLGHIVSEEGISDYPKKIEEIINWKTPNNVSKVKYFMGLAGHYRKFIEWF